MARQVLNAVLACRSDADARQVCRVLSALDKGKPTPELGDLGRKAGDASCRTHGQVVEVLADLSSKAAEPVRSYLHAASHACWSAPYARKPRVTLDGKPASAAAFSKRATGLGADFALLCAINARDWNLAVTALRAGVDPKLARRADVFPDVMDERTSKHVKALLAAGADPNALDGAGRPVFWKAIDHEPTLRLFVEAGATRLSCRSGTLWDLLRERLRQGKSPAAVEAVAKAGIDLNQGRPPGFLLVLSALHNRNRAAIRRVIKALHEANAQLARNDARHGNARWHAGNNPDAQQCLDELGVPPAVHAPRGTYTGVFKDDAAKAVAHADATKLDAWVQSPGKLKSEELGLLVRLLSDKKLTKGNQTFFAAYLKALKGGGATAVNTQTRPRGGATAKGQDATTDRATPATRGGKLALNAQTAKAKRASKTASKADNTASEPARGAAKSSGAGPGQVAKLVELVTQVQRQLGLMGHDKSVLQGDFCWAQDGEVFFRLDGRQVQHLKVESLPNRTLQLSITKSCSGQKLPLR